MARITLPAARKAARAVLRKYGTEYRYMDRHKMCQYVNTANGVDDQDSVGCFVGEVWKELGLDPHQLQDAFNHNFDSQGRPRRYGRNTHSITHKALAFLDTAQVVQDNRPGTATYNRYGTKGGTWGDAFAEGVAAATRV